MGVCQGDHDVEAGRGGDQPGRDVQPQQQAENQQERPQPGQDRADPAGSRPQAAARARCGLGHGGCFSG